MRRGDAVAVDTKRGELGRWPAHDGPEANGDGEHQIVVLVDAGLEAVATSDRDLAAEIFQLFGQRAGFGQFGGNAKFTGMQAGIQTRHQQRLGDMPAPRSDAGLVVAGRDSDAR